jgi:hypothetical protein
MVKSILEFSKLKVVIAEKLVKTNGTDNKIAGSLHNPDKLLKRNCVESDDGYLQNKQRWKSMQWNSAFFTFSLIIEDTTQKELQFIIPLKSVYNKNLGFIEQNGHFAIGYVCISICIILHYIHF